MMTTQVQVHLRVVLRQAVPVEVIKHLPAGIVQEVHQAEVQVPLLEVTRHLQAEEAVAVLRQEVQVRTKDQVQENPNTKILIEELQKTLFGIGFLFLFFLIAFAYPKEIRLQM